MKRRLRSPSGSALLVLFLVYSTAACTRSVATVWAGALSDQQRSGVMDGLPRAARESLIPLSEIFYARITSRRFNSVATFEDPSVRQFFTSIAAYSDYYAALVDALDRANIRFTRPTGVELLRIETDTSGSIQLFLRFVGKNDLPLRWWNASLLRRDDWRWQDGRWWVVPGKV